MIAHTPDNREIYYRIEGAGPELLLVHGGWPVYFEPLVEVLSPQFSCISFDRLGFRRSAHLDRNTTVDEQVTVLRNICYLLDSQLINSKLVTLEGQDHGMPIAAPKLVAEKLAAFMSECESKT